MRISRSSLSLCVCLSLTHTLSLSPQRFCSGQKPCFYIKKSDISPYYKLGDVVKTIYGTGILQSIRADGIHVVTVQSWKLANNTSPTLYVQADALVKEVFVVFFPFMIFFKKTSPTLRKVGDLVRTAYGKGKIIEIREGIVVVSPTDWFLANGKPPIYYLNARDGSLSSIKEEQAVVPSPPENVVEESTVLPRIKRAIELKDTAAEYYQKNDIETAASYYNQALTVLKVLFYSFDLIAASMLEPT